MEGKQQITGTTRVLLFIHGLILLLAGVFCMAKRNLLFDLEHAAEWFWYALSFYVAFKGLSKLDKATERPNDK